MQTLDVDWGNTMADITVTNLNDSAAGSLRDAIRLAEVNGGIVNIKLDPSLAGGTITLPSVLEIHNNHVTIDGSIDAPSNGPAAFSSSITISGDSNGDGLHNAGDTSHFNISTGGDLWLRTLSLVDGYSGGDGNLETASIENSGSFTARNVLLEDNYAEGAVGKNATIINNPGGVQLRETVFYDNQAVGGHRADGDTSGLGSNGGFAAVIVNTDSIFSQGTLFHGERGDTLVGIENLIGSRSGDLLRGGNATANNQNTDNVLNGERGDDVLLGDEGNDTLIGGAGTDIMTGGTGEDTFLFDNLSTELDIIIDFDQSGNDTLTFSGFGPGFDFSDIQLFTVNGNDVLVQAIGWIGGVVLQDADGLVDAGGFVFA